MKTAIRILVVTIALLPALLSGHIAAQTATAPDNAFRYLLTNDTLVSDRILEFDVYLMSQDPSSEFRLASVQAGILVNPKLKGQGTLKAELVAGSSELEPEQQPTHIQLADNCIKFFTNYLKIPPKGASDKSRGSIISATGKGTRICRIRISNSVPFQSVTPDLSFNLQMKPYPTRVARYIDHANVQLKCTSGNCVSQTVNAMPGKSRKK